jgi:hypothetical protein
MAENGEILRVVLEYIIPGASQVLNVFNWLIDDGAPSDEDVLADFADWAENVWGVNWADVAQDVAELDNVSIDVVDVQGHVLRNLGAQGIGLAGSVGGEIGVAAASGFLKADTAVPKTRGSKYVPGLGEGNLLDGVLTAETLADLLLLLADFFTVYVGTASSARYQPGVVSRTAEAFEPFVEAGYVTSIPGYQRRRKPNSGS